MSLSLNSEFVMCSENCYSSLRYHCLLSCKMCTFMFVCLSKLKVSHEQLFMMESTQPSPVIIIISRNSSTSFGWSKTFIEPGSLSGFLSKCCSLGILLRSSDQWMHFWYSKQILRIITGNIDMYMEEIIFMASCYCQNNFK